MARHANRTPACPAACVQGMKASSRLIGWLSGTGLCFLLLGLVALALPLDEGPELWKINTQHSITLFDVLSTGLLGIGCALIFLSASLWRRCYGRHGSNPTN